MPRVRRRTIPHYIYGEEVGGVFIGKWIEPRPGEQPKDYIIPHGPVLKYMGIKYAGGVVQLPNRDKEPAKTYTLPGLVYALLFLFPLIYMKFRGYWIIGFWHSHKPGHPGMSRDDKKAAQRFMDRLGVDRLVIGIECGGIMREGIELRNEEVKTIENKW